MALSRTIGPFTTTAIGIGEMGLTIEGHPSHEQGLETIHAAA